MSLKIGIVLSVLSTLLVGQPSLALADPSGCKTSTIEQVLIANKAEQAKNPELKNLKVTTVQDEKLVGKLIDAIIEAKGVNAPKIFAEKVVSFLIYNIESKGTYFMFAFDADQCGVAKGELPKSLVDGVLDRGA